MDELHKIFSEACNAYIVLRQELVGRGLEDTDDGKDLIEIVDFHPEDLPLNSEDIVDLASKAAAGLHQLLVFMSRAAPETGSSIMAIFDTIQLVRQIRSSCLLIAYALSSRDDPNPPAQLQLVNVSIAQGIVERLAPTEVDPED